MASWNVLVRVLAALLLSQLLHAGFWVVSRKAVIGTHGMAADVFTWFRYLISVPVLHLMLWLRTGQAPWKTLPAREHRADFIAYGCLHVYFGQYLLFFALKQVPAIMAALLSNLSPVFVFGIGLALGVEHLVHWRHAACLKLAGLAVSVTGAMTYTALNLLWLKPAGAGHERSYSYAPGLALLLVSLSGGALHHIKQKVCLNYGYTASLTATWGSTWGLLLISAIVCPRLSAQSFELDGMQVFVVFYDALLPSCALNVLQAWVTKETSPTFASAFGPLGTAVTAVCGWAFLGEAPTAATYASAPLILSGLYLLILGQHRQSAWRPSPPTPAEDTSSDSIESTA